MISPAWRYFVFASLLATLLFSLAACKAPPEASVTGKVKFNDEPLKFATVYFVSGDGQSRPCNVGLDGSYELKKVPLGLAKIKVVTYPPMPPGLSQEDGPNAGTAKKPVPQAIQIPAKYNDENKSGLAYEVKQVQSRHDILLSSN